MRILYCHTYNFKGKKKFRASSKITKHFASLCYYYVCRYFKQFTRHNQVIREFDSAKFHLFKIQAQRNGHSTYVYLWTMTFEMVSNLGVLLISQLAGNAKSGHFSTFSNGTPYIYYVHSSYVYEKGKKGKKIFFGYARIRTRGHLHHKFWRIFSTV